MNRLFVVLLSLSLAWPVQAKSPVRLPSPFRPLATLQFRVPEKAQWTIKVDAWIGKTHLETQTAAWVYSPGPSYKAKLYAVGPYFAGVSPSMVGRFDQVLAAEPNAVVFNGGYWYGDPYVSAGLLMVAGYAVRQFDFANTNGLYAQSAVLCIGTNGHIRPIWTGHFDGGRAFVAKECQSALQTGPFVVEPGGKNGISRLSTAVVRTILGFDAAGVPTLVVFQQPVDLMVAAEFLRAPVAADNGAPLRSGAVTIRNGATPSGLLSSSGLGLDSAVNLNGDAGAVAFNGPNRPVIGYSSIALPSAFSLQAVP